MFLYVLYKKGGLVNKVFSFISNS